MIIKGPSLGLISIRSRTDISSSTSYNCADLSIRHYSGISYISYVTPRRSTLTGRWWAYSLCYASSSTSNDQSPTTGKTIFSDHWSSQTVGLETQPLAAALQTRVNDVTRASCKPHLINLPGMQPFSPSFVMIRLFSAWRESRGYDRSLAD